MPKVCFKWDPTQGEENPRKYGTTFSLAQHTFANPKRLIALDATHYSTEERFFDLVKLVGGILILRFAYRADVIRIFGGVTGENERRFMNANVKYKTEDIGEPKVIADFLSPPSELAFRKEHVKATLALSKKGVDFFTAEVNKHHTQYQRMIRRLLDSYVDSQAVTSGSSGHAKKRRGAWHIGSKANQKINFLLRCRLACPIARCS